MTTKTSGGLSPLASLCLGAIRGWLGVVRRGRGGELRGNVPYTRLKASELQSQLSREFQVEVSAKTVQRALTQLVTSGHLSRRALYKHRYNRTYWYAPGPLEQQAEAHRPRSVAARFQGGAPSAPNQSPRPSQPVPTEGTRVSPQALNAQINHSPLKQANSPTAKQPPTEKVPCGQPRPLQEPVIKAWGKRRPTAQKPHTRPQGGRLQQAQERLAQVVQQAAAFKGFGGPGFRSVQAEKPLAVMAESAKSAGFLR